MEGKIFWMSLKFGRIIIIGSIVKQKREEKVCHKRFQIYIIISTWILQNSSKQIENQLFHFCSFPKSTVLEPGCESTYHNQSNLKLLLKVINWLKVFYFHYVKMFIILFQQCSFLRKYLFTKNSDSWMPARW